MLYFTAVSSLSTASHNAPSLSVQTQYPLRKSSFEAQRESFTELQRPSFSRERLHSAPAVPRVPSQYSQYSSLTSPSSPPDMVNAADEKTNVPHDGNAPLISNGGIANRNLHGKISDAGTHSGGTSPKQSPVTVSS